MPTEYIWMAKFFIFFVSCMNWCEVKKCTIFSLRRVFLPRCFRFVFFFLYSHFFFALVRYTWSATKNLTWIYLPNHIQDHAIVCVDVFFSAHHDISNRRRRARHKMVTNINVRVLWADKQKYECTKIETKRWKGRVLKTEMCKRQPLEMRMVLKLKDAVASLLCLFAIKAHVCRDSNAIQVYMIRDKCTKWEKSMSNNKWKKIQRTTSLASMEL